MKKRKEEKGPWKKKKNAHRAEVGFLTCEAPAFLVGGSTTHVGTLCELPRLSLFMHEVVRD